MSAVGVRVPDLILEQYALGELPKAETAELELALESDASLRLRLEELRASDAAILEEAPPAEIAAAIRRRMQSSAEASRPARGSAFKPATAVMPAAAAVLVVVGVAMAWSLFFPSVGDLSRPKGGAPGLSIYKADASGPAQLRDGELAAAGDVLQLRYAAGTEGYGAVFSLDGRGSLTRHLPEAGAPDTLSPRLAAGGASLPSAYELDDAPLYERFFMVSSSRAFELAAVAGALRDLAASADPGTAAPRLPAGLEWKSLLLRKSEDPETGGRR